ncbi:carboxypeptidase regulatory-like domain-containing protein [Micromonospora sp. CPCC 206061]|uniref:carboxypeptidase regulatory-like domain-containing protein n=1 Tax=Micromonospora sp. CPCC 206061 TaxID=3122410 RepID=UPI002FF3EE85
MLVRRIVSGLSGIAVVASALVVLPAPGSAAPAATPQPSCADAKQDAAAAAQTAEACGRRVEILADRTESSQTFANPDGTGTLEQTAQPVRVRKGDGWVPVDTTLTKTSDGSIAPRSTTVRVVFSGGGKAPLARIVDRDRELAMSWPDPLPVPRLSGDTAVYPEVLPGVDLRVTASATGFSEVLVVRSRKAAMQARLDTVRFGLATKGVTAKPITGGGLEARDAKGRAVFVSPTPLMWDSSAGESATPPDERAQVARVSPMPAKVSGGQLSVVPDREMLSDPATRYPVFIDPSWTGGIASNAWTSVWSKHPSSKFWQNATALSDGDITGSAGVGRTRDCSGCSDHKIRSFFRMNIAGVRGKQILTAQFRIQQRWSWTCSPKSNARVWLTGPISQNTTWNNQPGWDNNYTATAVADHKVNKAHGCLGTGDVEFNVKSIVARGVAGGWKDVTLGMRAIDEGTVNHWKRYNHATPKLSITYNTIPNAPSERKSHGLECKTGAARPYVWANSPSLSAKQSDVDSGQQSLTTHFYWWPLGGARSESNKLSKSSGNPSPVSVQIPAGRLADNTVYVWQAITGDTIANGPWSGTCEFATDFTVPNAPTSVASTEYPPDSPTQAPRGGVGLPGTFRITPPTNRPSDALAYAYSLNAGTFAEGMPTVPASTTDYTASVTLTPIRDGTNTLYVWTKERSGRFSTASRAYTFKVRSGSGPVAEWTFDEASGNAQDKTDHGNTATLAGGAARTPGRSNVGTALSLNGSTAYAATTAQMTSPHPDTGATVPMNSSGSFTAAAWVRLAATGGGVRHIVSYDGANVHALRLAYNGGADRWNFRVVPTDASGAAGSTIQSTSAPTVGKWTHVAGVYNAATRQALLYVNGTLEASATLAEGWGPHAAATTLSIGRTRSNAQWVDYWSGALDDVKVYNFAVTAADIGLLVAPLAPAISFPNGATATVGQPFTVRFDAGGDANVTAYRYSFGNDETTGTTVAANPAGGAATATITPTSGGQIKVYAKAVGAGSRLSTIAENPFQAVGAASLSGVVVDAETFELVSGAAVTLAPAGRTATTGPDGGFSFTGLTPGQVTVTATVGGRCGRSTQQTLALEGDPFVDLFVEPFTDVFGYTCSVAAAGFTPADQTVLPLTGDNAVTTVGLPFAFPFYGATHRSAWVDTNGIVSFVDPGGSHPYTNQAMPAPTEPNAVIAPFWDDLVVDASASVRTSATGSGADARFVIEWRNVHRKASTSQRLSFEAILAPDGTATFNYSGLDNDAERGSLAAVGIEDAVGEDGLAYLTRTAGLLGGQAISIDYPGDGAPVERFDLSGTVTDSASGTPVANATVSLDPAGLTATTNAQGRYQFDDLVADSYTVSSAVGQRCVSMASAQIDLIEAAAVNLGLEATGDKFGYTCATGPGTFVPAANVLTVPSSPGGTPVTLPFAFRLYGQAYTTAWVAAAGFVSFDDPPPNWGMYENGPVPHKDQPDATVYPFWDDLQVDDQASVRTQVFGTAPNRYFVVEWRDVAVAPSAASRMSVEVVLYEDGRIAFHYAGLDDAAERGASATVGIENGDGKVGSQFSYNEVALASGTGILYTPPAAAKISGTVTRIGGGEPASNTPVSLLPSGATTTTAADGTYQFTGVPAGDHAVVAGAADGVCGGVESAASVSTRGLDSTVDLSVGGGSDESGNGCRGAAASFEPTSDVLALTGDDAFTQITMPFPVTLYGQSYTTAWVDTNGVVSFEEPDGPAHDVFPIPSRMAPNQPNGAVYAFWKDWVVDGDASVRTALLGTGSSRRFVIEWRNVLSWDDNESRVSFQVVFHETGDIAVAWNDIGTRAVEQGATGIVGIENAEGSEALVYSSRVPVLRSGRGVTFEVGAGRTGQVTGVVRCAGAAVSGAQVSVAGRSGITGADGRYTLADVPVGPQVVVATLTGACAGSATAPVAVAGDASNAADITAAGSSGYTVTAGSRGIEPTSDVLALTGDDAFTEVALPFPVTLYGQSHTTAWVDTNGVVSFEEPEGSAHEICPIPSQPSPGQPNLAVYPFWEDWVVDENASVRTAVLGAGTSRRFVVEWRNVLSFDDWVSRASFQVVFHENGDIAIAWADIGGRTIERGGTSTVGVENGDGTVALQYAHQQPVIRSGEGLLFHPVS